MEVAAFFRVNDRTVYRLAISGGLPGFKVAGTWRFLPEDINSWIEAQKRVSGIR
ncbi:MAG: helix-turn-helix domain-containing protein [Candidatus Thiodiazotropha sp. (ex Dulcina madagascariensis)]|nr:helix-turn-helix domain-containing protein [Candidatus Thiodiazotropha sp. (ex Dulcina madagascariensis)]